jgi:hypothetical protein
MSNSGQPVGKIDGTSEFTIPIIADRGVDEAWSARLQLPAELAALSNLLQLRILDDINDAVQELRRLTSRTVIGAEPTAPVSSLVVNCAVWLRQSVNGRWRSGVSFTWPGCWADLNREIREAIFEAISRVIDEARRVLQSGDA